MSNISERRTMLPVSIEILRDNPVVMERRELAARMEDHANAVARLINESTTETDVLGQNEKDPKIPIREAELDVLYDLHDMLDGFAAATIGKLSLHLQANNLHPFNKPPLPEGAEYKHGFIILPPQSELNARK